MLDWFTGVLSCDASHLRTDKVCRIEPSGHIAWESNCWFNVKGSYESSIQVRQNDFASRWIAAFQHDQMGVDHPLLQMSGNPVKFLQGHNAFGPSVSLWKPVVLAAVRALPETVRPVDAGEGISLGMWPSRIDIAVSVDMGTYENVREWLRCISTGSRSRHGRALVSGDTVYWGQHSRRWSLKSYCKFDEMGVHPMGDLTLNQQFRESVRSILRIELCLRSLELRDLEKKGAVLNESLLWDYFENKVTIGRLNLSRVKDLDVLSLPHQAILMRWLKGEEVSKVLKQSTFYRYRRIILDNFGADIAIPCQDQESMLERVQFDAKYLREHEVKVAPDIFAGRILGPDSFSFSNS
jgi:hypothetical protein